MSIEERLDENGYDLDDFADSIIIDDFDDCIIGITNKNQFVYDYEAMVDHYQKKENCSEDEAKEFINYNIVGVEVIGSKYVQPVILYYLEEGETWS